MAREDMLQNEFDRASELMANRRFIEALQIFDGLILQDANDAQLRYLAGQCCRFSDDLPGAVAHLENAVRLETGCPQFYLALGIALQLVGQYEESKQAFAHALALDSEYVLAMNSLALTQKRMGEYEKALHNLDIALKTLTKKIAKSLKNDRGSQIFKTRTLGSDLWAELAINGALYLCADDGNVQKLCWPTGEQAKEEESTEAHAGLYWVDGINVNDKNVRLFLPNFFNTFREVLKRDGIYANLIGNKGTVLELVGEGEEAGKCYLEAEAFASEF